MHRRFDGNQASHRTRGRAAAVVAALIAASVLTVGSGPVSRVAQAAPPKPDCTIAQLKPELGAVMVNQGLNYPILNRGKQTLVRLFLRLPTTCTAKSAIAMTGGTLTITLRDKDGAPFQPPVSASVGPIQAVSGNLPAAVQASGAASDPLFLVPGSLLLPPINYGDRFSATFSASLTFKVGGVVAQPAPPVTVSGGPAHPITAQFEPRTSALRILVVKMGDAAAPTPFSGAAQAAVQNAMLDLSRMGPFPDGTGDLTATAVGGVRYSFSPGLLDIGPAGLKLMSYPGTLFCGSSANFAAVSTGLGAILANYNAANPTAQADRVLGVVDAALSRGALNSCDEGRAAVPSGGKFGVAAWVRAVADGTYPSQTGAVLAQEILHTFGGCATATGDNRCPTLTYHSTTTTDFSGGMGYNLSTRARISNPPTVMRFNSQAAVWNRTTTLYETSDYLLFSCIVTPGFVLPTGYSSIPGCTSATTGSAGTSTGVPAGPVFFLTGSTDGLSTTTSCAPPSGSSTFHAPGTSVFDSFYQLTTADLSGQADQASPFRLRYYDQTGNLLLDQGVPTGTSGATLDMGSQTTAPPDRVTFSATLPFDASTRQVRLVHDDPADAGDQPLVLWCRDRTDPPSISAAAPSTTGLIASVWSTIESGDWEIRTARPDGSDPRVLFFSPGPATIQHPVWSPDGTRVAYWDFNFHSYRVVDADGTDEHGIGPGMGAFIDPTWSPDSQRVAYLANVSEFGSAIRIVDATSGVPVGPDIVYPDVTMYHAAWSPDGTRFTAWDDGTLPGGADDARIIVVNADGTGTPVQVSTAASPPAPYAHPAWSPDGSRVAYESVTGGFSSIVTAPATGGGPATTVVTAQGMAIGGPLEAPDWSADGRQVLFGARAGGMYMNLLFTVDAAGGGAPVHVAMTGTGALLEAWGSWSHADPGASGFVSSPTPDDITVTLTYTCPGTGQVFPVAVGIPASQVEAAKAAFFATFDPTEACAGGTLAAIAKDGIDTSEPWVIDDPVPLAATTPIPAIDYPVDGSTYDATATIALQGRAVDGDDGSLCEADPSPCSWSLSNGATTHDVGTGPEVDLAPGVNAPAEFVTSGAWRAGSYVATFAAEGASTSVTFQVRSAPPIVIVTGVVDGAVYSLGSVPAAGCETIDSGTGIGTPATLAMTGGTTNGVGSFTATCDGATSATSPPVATPPVSASYAVLYAGVSGIQQPINADNTSVFSRNRVVPVKFQIAGSPPQSGFVTTAWTVVLQKVDCSTFDQADAQVEQVPSNTPFTTFRWDAAAAQYVYNAQISALRSGWCAVFKVTLDDGSDQTAATEVISPVFKVK